MGTKLYFWSVLIALISVSVGKEAFIGLVIAVGLAAWAYLIKNTYGLNIVTNAAQNTLITSRDETALARVADKIKEVMGSTDPTIAYTVNVETLEIIGGHKTTVTGSAGATIEVRS